MANPHQPAEARSSTAHTQRQAAVLVGQLADHLNPTAGLTEGACDEVGVAHPVPVLPQKPQIDRERLAVIEHTAHRRRIAVAPPLGERVDGVPGSRDRVRAIRRTFAWSARRGRRHMRLLMGDAQRNSLGLGDHATG